MTILAGVGATNAASQAKVCKGARIAVKLARDDGGSAVVSVVDGKFSCKQTLTSMNVGSCSWEICN
jgi:hypothetical protein